MAAVGLAATPRCCTRFMNADISSLFVASDGGGRAASEDGSIDTVWQVGTSHKRIRSATMHHLAEVMAPTASSVLVVSGSRFSLGHLLGGEKQSCAANDATKPYQLCQIQRVSIVVIADSHGHGGGRL